MHPRRKFRSFALIAGTIALGITVRRVPLGLPAFVTKYAGSALWALMIYWLVTTWFPEMSFRRAGLVAAAAATAIEFFKFVHTPALDTFRLTLPGILMLGRFFSAWNLLAYYAAIAVGAALLDPRIRA